MSELGDHLKALAPQPQRVVDLGAVERRARRLARRSRALVLVAVVFVGTGTGVGVAATAGGGSVATRVATTAPGTQRGHRAASVAPPTSLRVVGADVAFPTPRDGIVVIAAETNNKNPAAAWVDTTSDGGRRWSRHRIPLSVGSVVDYPPTGELVMSSPSDGWLGAWRTTDGGLSWSRSQSGGPVDGLVATARGGWAESGPGTYPWSAPGEPFAPLTSTPHGSSPVVRTSAADAFELGARQGRTPVRLLRTRDGGRQWGSVGLPCSLKDRYGAGPNFLAAGPGGSLWLACWASQGNIDGSEGVVTLYRSVDEGSSWQRTTPPGPVGKQDILDSLGGFYPLAGGVEWLVEDDSEAGFVPPLRSTDNGRTWQPVLPRHLPGKPKVQIEVDSITVISADNAWVAATAYHGNDNGTPVLLHTTNGGRRWTTIDLPW